MGGGVINKTSPSTCGRGCGEKGTLPRGRRECRRSGRRGKQSGGSSRNEDQSCQATQQPLSWEFTPKIPKRIHRERGTPCALPHLNESGARTWKRPTCAAMEGGMRKTWPVYTREYYWVMKKDGMGPLATARTGLEKTKNPMTALTWGTWD